MELWYDIPFAARNYEQHKQAQQAYYSALMSTRQGREVLCDMHRRIHDDYDDPIVELALTKYYDDTVTLCGVVVAKEIVDAFARIAKNYVHPEPPPVNEDGYKE